MKLNILRHVVSALNKAPWLTEISMGFKYEEDVTSLSNGNPTMCTDGHTVYYHPMVMRWSPAKIEGVIVHEWLHGAHLHMHRLSRINPEHHKLWNIACDAVINPICKTFGWNLSDGIFIPWADGLTAEQVFVRLLKESKGSTHEYSGPMRSPKPQSGSGQPEGDDSDGNDDSDGDEVPAVVASEQEAAESNSALARMLASAMAAGKVPSGLKLTVSEWLKPKVDWRHVLREFCTRISKDGWSYARTHGSYRSLGLYAPARYSKSAGDVVIVRDTSGSLHAKQREVAAEAAAVLSQCSPRRIFLIDADASVHQVLEIESGGQMPDDALGGGDTDFRPVFDEIESRSINPDVMIFITDLEGVFPDQAPDYPVLWATIGTSLNPPFGQSVTVE